MKFSRNFVSTGGVGDPETTDLDRRAQDAVKLHGVIKEVDYKKTPPVYRVAFGDEKDEDNYILTDWLPAAGGRAKGDTDTHFLEKGEKVAIMSEGGELATGYVVPAGNYTEKEDEKAGADKAGVFRKKFATGAEISYDRSTGDMLFKASGKQQSQQSGGGGQANAQAGDQAGGGQQGQEIKGTCTIIAGGCTFVMKDGKVTIQAPDAIVLESKKIITKGDTYLGGEEGAKLVHRKGDVDSGGDTAEGAAKKVYAL